MSNKFWHKFDLWLASIVLSFMVIVVMVQVVSRMFGHPLSWSEEIAKWTMIWITFIGASYSFRNGGLIRVDYFIRKHFSESTQRIINIIDMSLLGIFFVYLGYSAILYMQLMIKKNQVYQITGVPKAIIVSSLVIGSILCVIFSISQIIQILQRKDVQTQEPSKEEDK